MRPMRQQPRTVMSESLATCEKAMLETIGIFAIIGGIIAAIAYYLESKKKNQRYYQARADVMQIVKIIEKYHATYGEYLIVEKKH
jgi:Tfp pilus assembly protein PilE